MAPNFGNRFDGFGPFCFTDATEMFDDPVARIRARLLLAPGVGHPLRSTPQHGPQHTLSLYFFLSLSRTCGGNDCKLIPLLFLYLSICSPPTTTPQVGKCSRPPLRRSSVVLSLSLSLSLSLHTTTLGHPDTLSLTYVPTYAR